MLAARPAAYTPIGSTSPTSTATYTYDAFGNQVEEDGWSSTGGNTTLKVGLDGWDTARPSAMGNDQFVAWADLNSSNTLTARHMFGVDGSAPVASETAGGTVSWYATDYEGSVRQVLNNSGTVTNAVTYDAYGNITSGTLADRFGYTGGQWDSLTGLVGQGNGTRRYDPVSGRWYQPDPMGFAAGDANLYRYVGNDPTGYVDPSGMDEIVISNNQVSFNRYYRFTLWSNGGNYAIGTLVNLKGINYVQHGKYLVPLDIVRDAIERTFTIGYGGEWREDANNITNWFKQNDVSGQVRLPMDQRKVADRMFGPTVIAGVTAAAVVNAMVTSVTESVLIQIATTFGPAKFVDFLSHLVKKGYRVIKNGKGEILHVLDSTGKKLTKEELEVLSKEFAPDTPPLRPDKIYTGSKKHGVDWKEGPATAKNLGKPQGQWTKKDLEFGGEKASTLAPGEGQSFPLPEGSTSVVHLPDGTTVKATHIWVRNNGSETFHGYPHLGDR